MGGLGYALIENSLFTVGWNTAFLRFISLQPLEESILILCQVLAFLCSYHIRERPISSAHNALPRTTLRPPLLYHPNPSCKRPLRYHLPDLLLHRSLHLPCPHLPQRCLSALERRRKLLRHHRHSRHIQFPAMASIHAVSVSVYQQPIASWLVRQHGLVLLPGTIRDLDFWRVEQWGDKCQWSRWWEGAVTRKFVRGTTSS